MAQSRPNAVLLFSDDATQREYPLDHFPFTIGRDPSQDLPLAFPFVSRSHAQIVWEDPHFIVVDIGSRGGTFVNGVRVHRGKLEDGDRIQFGGEHVVELRFRTSEMGSDVPLRTLLHQAPKDEGRELSLGKLSWFVQAARRLNDLGGVNEILTALIETTLSLTGAERGYVFLRDVSGALELAAGWDAQHGRRVDESTVSNTAIQRSLESGSEYIITDTLSAEAGMLSNSMVAQSLRAILCIPLRKPGAERKNREADVLGVLYLDSRKERNQLTSLDSDLLNLIASEAAMLVEHTNLARVEEERRRYLEELKIASDIQQGLMRVRIPELKFARVEAHSLPCKGIGGDFYDVVCMDDGLYIVVADISGKGLSAAILGSTLQGLIYAQLLARQPLAQIAQLTNQFICHKNIGKYATLVLMRLTAGGEIEYINCGHVQPLIQSGEGVSPLRNSNLPVGLIASAGYESEQLQIKPGERIVIVTDGVTEAETSHGEAYGDDRLRGLIDRGATLAMILEDVNTFAGGAQLEDDCTLLEIRCVNCHS
jgi:sigma-B regulation protein RsbU (phosphoserine phosphatase)